MSALTTALLVLLGLGALLVLSVLYFAVKLRRNYQEPFPSATAALVPNASMRVEHRPDGSVAFVPFPTPPTLGLVYFPGALVHHHAYAPLCREIARQSHAVVVLLRVPARMAPLGLSRAVPALASFPLVRTWAIGGHSLGGPIAAAFIERNPDVTIKGCCLHAAYLSRPLPAGKRALQVLGSEDGIVRPEKLAAGAVCLGERDVVCTIAGGNHSGFGHYGPQTFPAADGERAISLEEQQQQVAASTSGWLVALAEQSAALGAWQRAYHKLLPAIVVRNLLVDLAAHDTSPMSRRRRGRPATYKAQ